MNDLKTRRSREESRRKIIESMMAQKNKRTDMVGGRAVPYHWGEALGEIGTALINKSNLDDTDERLAGIEEEEKSAGQAKIAEIMATMNGVDAVPQSGGPLRGDGPYQQYEPEVEGVKADPVKAALMAAQSDYVTPEAKTLFSSMATSPKKDGNKVVPQGGVLASPTGEPLFTNPAAEPKKPKLTTKAVNIGDEKWQMWAIDEDGNKVKPVGEPYKRTADAPENKSHYVIEREKERAKEMTEIGKSAKAAYSSNQALDRLITASSNGAEGGAQPLITGVKNMLASVGVNSEKLTNEIIMGQSVAQMKVDLIAKFGARGLTDKDMQVIAEALPRVSTSHEARVKVAEIMKKLNNFEIAEYSKALEFDEENYTDLKQRTPDYIQDYRKSQSPKTLKFDAQGTRIQ